MRRIILILCFALAGVFCFGQSSFSVKGLTCEELVNPIAIDNTDPHFGWKINSDSTGAFSTAYQVLVATTPEKLDEKNADLWNSGKVLSSESVSVRYEGKPLASKAFAFWKVRVWDNEGNVSEWSDPASFGIGFLEDKDWASNAAFIGVPRNSGKSEVSPLLRKKFTAEDGAERYLLHVNSLGYHEAYVNGTAVSDAVLSPAVSQFGVRTRIGTYDVTSLVHSGENDIFIWTGKGWYQTHNKAVVPGGPYVRAQLDCTTAKGVTAVAATDGSWEYAESERRTFGPWRPHEMGGEIVDARKVLPDFKSQTLDQLKWKSVKVADIPAHKATPQMCEVNRIVKTLHPVAVHKVGKDSYIYDMGTCFVGFTEIQMPVVKKGKTIELYYEDYYLNDLADFRDKEYTDKYIGDGESKGKFSSKFNYKGYRYLKIIGLAEPLPLESITGGKVRTDYKAKTTFECSDKDINAIYNMIHNTCHALTLGGYMVDCPQVERFGYGGDGNASTPTLQTLGYVAPLYMNWIESWADCQRPDGGMPHTAPNPYPAGGGPYWCTFIIPAAWHTYINYGDRRLIDRYYPNMQKWIEYAEAHSVDGILKDWGETDYRSWYLGDWAVPHEVIDQQDPRSIDIVSNCVLSDAYAMMAKIAAVLGKEEDVQKYQKRHEEHNALIHKTYFNEKDNSYASCSQTDLIYPMLVGATPEQQIKDVEATLFRITEKKHDGHLCTGLVGIPVMTQWATREGKTDFIYSMLKKREYPGYLFMIDNGATLTWEMWEGSRSQIHNCFNGIGTWFYQALAGLAPDENAPGYRHMTIRPQLVEGIDWVKVSKDTPYGMVELNWEKNGKSFTIDVTLPFGTSATVVLPDGSVKEITAGSHELKCTL